MNWLKVLTKSGRQSLVREAVAEYLTPEQVAKYAATGIAKALEAGSDKIGAERAAKIAKGCEYGGKFCAELGAAVNPEGDGGMKVTEAETKRISELLYGSVEALVTTDSCKALVETIVAKVP